MSNFLLICIFKVEQQPGDGILGLGLNSLSNICHAMSDRDSCQPTIYNIFDQYPNSPNFIGLSIERSGDGEHTAGGILSINEYDPRFEAAANTTKISLAPADCSRWTIPMDGLSMDGQKFSLTSHVEGVAENTSIALIDSGTSLAYIPEPAVDFIYGNMDGAVHFQRNDMNMWVVPCLQPVDLAFSFGYVNVLHPPA